MRVYKRLECKGLLSIVGFYRVDVLFKGTVHFELKRSLSSCALHGNKLLPIELRNGQGLKCGGEKNCLK